MNFVNLMCSALELLDHVRYIKPFIIIINIYYYYYYYCYLEGIGLFFYSCIRFAVWCCVVDKDILVVVVNDNIHVRQAAVAYFHVVLALVV